MTFLQLINAVLREINEVEITTVSSTRGIQTSVKDFINKAQRDIINSEIEWPFTVVSQSFTTTAGTAEYARESDAKTVNYDSFTVQESASTAEKKLRYLEALTSRAMYHAARIEEIAEMVEDGRISPISAKVAIDARKWIASRFHTNQFSEKLMKENNLDKTDIAKLHLQELKKMMDKSKELTP